MIQTLYRVMIELTNGKWSSELLRKFARSKVSRYFIPSFSRIYQINQSEMEKKMDEFSTLHDFFIRKLKKEARKINEDPISVISPVDAVIEDIGTIQPDHIIHVKGKEYSIAEMLGEKAKAEKYSQGTYMIFYLSPSHYHRIHSPVSGTVSDQWTLGLKSYPVNKWGLKYGSKTLSKNYRTITEVQHGNNFISIVKVGAMFVNSIELIHEGDQLVKGEEMAYFSFGSTVILLFEKDAFTLQSAIQAPAQVKVGECIGQIVQ